ncbi:hypothetical protein FHS89_002634 [Rubricella aquisinus]|uniref:Cryptochrome/DNA photolyase FAD-binding domain-containing protein n=1 Tax=Rubricella aquisinus TaxID=2028108 RepID=A0A840WRD3_9RHOB|nr:FAD-binding domain-containing protein [Rubricella aquisinus]MBB5516603.1 hypothetical protein [Rubricella aquisinus]
MEQTQFQPSRQAGLTRLQAFADQAGAAYAKGRNHDHGPMAHNSVSHLSPWITRRLVTEREVLDHVLTRHSLATSEKFVQEVFWRGYFKGWLEQRPDIWRWYVADRDRYSRTHADDQALTRVLQANSDIPCMNAWVAELIETGYLHNHARMWFASIWIFTLRLPWQLGADFFLRHLLDGDAASNTLSWRWVAGLHTVGKHYVARASNIEAFSGARFGTVEDVFAQDPVPLTEPHDRPPAAGIAPTARVPDAPFALLVTEADCTPDWIAGARDAAGVVTVATSRWRSPSQVSERIVAFERAALAEATHWCPAAMTLDHPEPGALTEWVKGTGCRHLITPYIPAGWQRDWIARERPRLSEAGITLHMPRRDYDTLVWPHATAGFFKVKKKIPGILAQLGLTN